MKFYKRIREIESQKDYQSLQDELIDRFGEYPDQVAYLLEIGLGKAIWTMLSQNLWNVKITIY